MVYAISLIISLAFALTYVVLMKNSLKLSEVLSRKRSIYLSLLAFASMLPLVLVAGLRKDIGADYGAYDLMFREGWSYVTDPGWYALSSVMGIFTNESTWLFLVSACITVGIFYFVIYKYSTNILLSIFLFATSGLYLYSLNVTRQYISVAICLLVYFCVKDLVASSKKQRAISAALLFIATLFHKTTLFVVGFYLIFKGKKSYMLWIPISIFFFLLIIFRNELIQAAQALPVMSDYQNLGSFFIADVSYFWIIICMSLLATNLYIKKTTGTGVLASFEVNALIAGLVLYSIGSLATSMMISDRLMQLIKPLYIFIIPLLIASLPKKYLRICATLLTIVVFTIFFTLMMQDPQYYPYQSILGSTL